MESVLRATRRDVERSLRGPLSALKTLLEATQTHVDVPPETRYCLERMAAQVLEMAQACEFLESMAADRFAPDDRVADGKVVNISDLERSGRALDGLLGSDLFDQLDRSRARASTLDPDPADQMLERSRPLRPQHGRPVELTRQEQRILDLIAQGCTNRQIAGELYLAEKTVKNYVSNMLRKLGMERRTQAAVYATRIDRAALAGSASGTHA